MKRYNTFWRRLVAVVIDSIILLPLTYVDTYSVASKNKFLFFIGLYSSSIIYFAYFIILHGKYGQTLGKKLMKVKVLDVDEKSLLGIKRAITRELPWVVSTGCILTYLAINALLTGNLSFVKHKEDYDSFTFLVSFSWMLIELLTMLSNYRRRALQDYLAKSVVINLSD